MSRVSGHSGAPPPCQPPFLPMYPDELRSLGWKGVDVLLVSGDAYVDHPSFAMALLGRALIAAGFTVGVIAQPPWENETEALAAITRLGRPRLLAGIGAGAVDSMLAHYTAFRKKRSDDAYTPGGMAGARPNRASLVYAGLVRRAFADIPLVIGGIEASLRRASHYDFWSDSLRRSILLDSKADLLACGMGEKTIVEAARAAARALDSPLPHSDHRADHRADLRAAFRALARDIPGTASPLSLAEAEARLLDPENPCIPLPSHEDILADPEKLVHATLALEKQVHQARQDAVQTSARRAVLLKRPASPMESAELDALYALPFSRLPHPSYTAPVPAWETIRTSITSHRGCGGGCAFCSLAQHQGRRVTSRGRDSILAEARRIAQGPRAGSPGKKPPAWAGSISDVGGPSANMWQATCTLDTAACTRPSCLFPSICPGFSVDQSANAKLLREVAVQPGVRHVRVASGLRFDLALRDPEALAAYTMEFTGGQLKIAPEHSSARVLRYMRKPSLDVFERFMDAFAALSRKAGKEQYVIPYLMSAHPGCGEEDMRHLAAWLAARGWKPRQVQCFIPTPGTLATAMFYSGKDGQGNSVPVARTDAERLRLHHMLLMGSEEGKKRAGAKNGASRHNAGPETGQRKPFGKRR